MTTGLFSLLLHLILLTFLSILRVWEVFNRNTTLPAIFAYFRCLLPHANLLLYLQGELGDTESTYLLLCLMPCLTQVNK